MASIKRNIFYNILLTTSQIAFSLVSLPYISRVLGPFQLGRVSFVDSATQYFIITASLGIPIYGIREIAKVVGSPVALKKTFSELLLIQIITSAVLFLVYLVLVLFLDRFHAEERLFHLGLLQVLLSAFVTDWFFQGMENYAAVALRSFVMRLVSIAAILIFVKNEHDVFLYYTIWSGAVVLNMAISLSSSYSYINFKNLDLKRHFKPVMTFFSTRFVTSIYVILLSVFIGYLENKVYVAYFTSAYKIYTVSVTLILAFSSVLIPKLSAYHQANMHEESARLLSRNFNVIINISLPIMAVMMFFAGPVIHILLGDRFLPAQADLLLLAPLVLVISISNVLSLNILTPVGKERDFLKATVYGMIFNLCIVFFLISAFRDVGASISLLATECLVCGLLYYYALPYLKNIVISLKTILLNFVSCCICFGAIRFGFAHIALAGNQLVMFMMQICACGVVYLLMEVFVMRNVLYRELYHLALKKIGR
ncbi:MAG: oligosaccharide flippase family protein [Bacteroidota bacterium]